MTIRNENLRKSLRRCLKCGRKRLMTRVQRICSMCHHELDKRNVRNWSGPSQPHIARRPKLSESEQAREDASERGYPKRNRQEPLM